MSYGGACVSPEQPEALMPDPEQVKGACPACGGPMVDTPQYFGGRGTIPARRCWLNVGMGAGCPGKSEG